MNEETAHISSNINKMLSTAFNATVFKKKVTDKNYSKKQALEEVIYAIVIESGFLSDEEIELLKKALDIE